MVPFRAASAEENGLKVGSGRLHPSFEVTGEYDSRVKVGVGSTSGVGGFVLHLRPGIDFENGSKATILSLRATGDGNLYTGLVNRGNRNLSYFGGDLALSLDMNPKGAVGFVLEDHLAYSDRNSAISLGTGYRSVSNSVSARLPIRPGGKALEIVPSYTLQLEAFVAVLTSAEVDPKDLNYFSHKPELQAKWRFLPKTAVIVDVSADFRQYMAASGGNLIGLYSRAGLSGLITPKLSLVVNAGYGRTLVSPLNIFSSVIGQAELSFIPNTFTRLKLGYVRTFLPVPQKVWFEDNRAYAGGSMLLGGRLLFDFSGSFDYVRFADGSADFVVLLDLGLRGRITEWLEVGGGYTLEVRLGASSAYQRHIAGVLAKVRY
jgi:hypothetical protein